MPTLARRWPLPAVAVAAAIGLGLILPLVMPAQAQGRPPAAVEIVTAETRAMTPQIVATGQVTARDGAELAAAIGGRLEWIAEPGTVLARNAVVARIDVEEIRLQRAEQQARVTRAEVALRQAEREHERLRAIGELVSQVQVDQAGNTRDLAAADLRIARALLRQTDERIARSVLRSPFAGVVSERRRRIGEEVARGDVLARLQDAGTAEFRLFLPLRHLDAVRAGSRVQLQTAAGPVPASVRAIVPVGDARSQSFEVLIDVPATTPPIAIGSSLRVEVPLAGAVATLAVPRDAVVIRQDGLAVFRIGDDGRSARRVPVTTGVADGDWVAVHGDLAAGSRVIVRGAENLRDGDAVQIVGGAANAAAPGKVGGTPPVKG